MNTRRTNATRVGEKIANTGVIHRGNQVRRQIQAVVNDNVPVNPMVIMDADVMEELLLMYQSISTQAQAITTQDTKRLFLE